MSYLTFKFYHSTATTTTLGLNGGSLVNTSPLYFLYFILICAIFLSAFKSRVYCVNRTHSFHSLFLFFFRRVKIPGIINFILRLQPIIIYITSLLNINVTKLALTWKIEVFPCYYTIFLMLLVFLFIFYIYSYKNQLIINIK